MNGRGAYQKKVRNIASLDARHKLLVSGLEAPGNLPKALLQGLTGQRAFAALSIPTLKISPMALNTMKSLAGSHYPEADRQGNSGFAYLNSLRTQLKTAQENQTTGRSVKAKTERVENKLEELSGKLEATELLNLARSRAYFDLYSKVNALVKEGFIEEVTRLRLFNTLDSHHAAFGNLFTPSRPESDTGGVIVPFRPKDER